ncbi:MAG: hypothetical protein ACXVJI_20210, partial [Mucilaginibacter sp.]
VQSILKGPRAKLNGLGFRKLLTRVFVLVMLTQIKYFFIVPPNILLDPRKSPVNQGLTRD